LERQCLSFVNIWAEPSSDLSQPLLAEVHIVLRTSDQTVFRVERAPLLFFGGRQAVPVFFRAAPLVELDAARVSFFDRGAVLSMSPTLLFSCLIACKTSPLQTFFFFLVICCVFSLFDLPGPSSHYQNFLKRAFF